MIQTDKARLRMLDFRPIEYEGETYLMLRDPLLLSENSMMVPQPFIPLLALCDGTRTVAGLRASLALRHSLFLSQDHISQMLEILDGAFLLDNQRYKQARQQALIDFRQAEFRQPTSSGQSYPENVDALTAYLDNFFSDLDKEGSSGILLKREEKENNPNHVIRGLVSPHIDYERGGRVYAQVWGQAAQAARKADLAIIFGTDHFSEGLPISLTRQNYATPYGVLPTETRIVDELAAVIGQESAFAGELHHRGEHSIELAAVWLHYIRGGKPIPMIPILTGSFDAANKLGDRDLIEGILEVLKKEIRHKNVLVVAAGDLSHIGPAFESPPVDPGKLIQLKAADDELINAICRGDADAFYNSILRIQDANNVCGTSPIFMTLRLLNPVQGEKLGYAVCSADENQTSVVTICGTVLY